MADIAGAVPAFTGNPAATALPVGEPQPVVVVFDVWGGDEDLAGDEGGIAQLAGGRSGAVEGGDPHARGA